MWRRIELDSFQNRSFEEIVAAQLQTGERIRAEMVMADAGNCLSSKGVPLEAEGAPIALPFSGVSYAHDVHYFVDVGSDSFFAPMKDSWVSKVAKDIPKESVLGKRAPVDQ